MLQEAEWERHGLLWVLSGCYTDMNVDAAALVREASERVSVPPCDGTHVVANILKRRMVEAILIRVRCRKLSGNELNPSSLPTS